MRSAVSREDESGQWVPRPMPLAHHSDSDDDSDSSSDSDEQGSHNSESSSSSRRSSATGTLEDVASSAAPSPPTTQPTTGRRSASPQAASADRVSSAHARPASRASPALIASAPTPPLVPHPPPRNSSRPSTRGSPTLSAASSPASTSAAGSMDATAIAAEASQLNVAGSTIAPLAPRPPPKQARAAGRNARRGLTPSQIAARAERKAAAANAEAKEEALAEAADVEELSRVVAAAKPAFVAATELSDDATGPSAASAPSAARVSRFSAPIPAPGAAASVPSSVSVLSRIDFLAASRAPVEDILSAKYNPDPADARAPDRDKKLGYEVAYNEARETAAMNRADASNAAAALDWMPYHLQGDSSLYHSQLLVFRDSLQYHPRLTKWFSRYWHSFAHHVHVGFMSYREYEAMHLRMTKVLFEHWERKDALSLCRSDWRRDTRALPGVAVAITSTAGSGGAASLRATAGTLMGYPHFSKSLFELVDLWTTTVDIEEYVDFLAILYARITAIKDREIAPGIVEAVEPLADSPGGSPNAPTRHHADPAHAHNATAEERRKRARAAAALAEENRRKSGPLDLLGPSADDSATPAATASLTKPASPVPEESEESSLSTVGGEQYWAGFGFMFQTNVDQVRERKRARAEALAFEAEHGGSEALAALRREDDRRRLHADGSIDSGTSKILPMVDHRSLIGDGYKVDPEDSLTKRFPAPDFAKMREQQMLADAQEALERKHAQEEAELAELAFGLASKRVLENMPLSDEQKAEKKAERIAAKAAAEEEKRLAADAAAETAAAQAPPEIEEAATKLAVDLMPSSSSSSDDEADGAGKKKKTGETADSSKRSPVKKGIASLEQPTGVFAASLLTSKKFRAVLKPSPALVAARAKRNKQSDHRSDADWAAATAARQEESRRQIIDKAIAARRQIRVQKALQAAQRRLAEVKKVEARRLAELAVKEERETDFFRQLDASIAVADPSYVAPALPPGRHRGRNSEFSSFDSSEALPEGDEGAAVEGHSSKAGHRSRNSGVQRLRGPLSRSGSRSGLRLQHSLPEAELEKLRADRARIEEKKKQQRMEKAAAIAAGLDFVTIDDDEPEDALDDPSLANVVEEEGETGLRVGLAPVDESGAYDEYTPALQMQLSEEIAKLAMLDANLRRSLPSSSTQVGVGAHKATSIGSPRRGPQKLVTAAEMQAARQALVAASNRLKFLRKKAILSRKSGMENRAELRELAELEAKLEGRVNKNGDVLELSFLALAQQSNHLSDSDADVTGSSTYTGFGVRSLQAPGSSGGGASNWPASGGRNMGHVPGMGEEEAAKWQGDSKFWALRKRLAKRRVLKYSAMAVLAEVPSDEEKDEEQQRVLTIKLGAPTLAAHTGAATAAIGQRSSVISYKRTAIERVLLDEESKARSSNNSFVPFLGDESLDLDFDYGLRHRRHTSFGSTMGGRASGTGSRAHFSRRRDHSDSSNISARVEMSESTSNLLSILTNQAMEAAGTSAQTNTNTNATNDTEKQLEPKEEHASQSIEEATAGPSAFAAAHVASAPTLASPSRALPALHRGLVHKSTAYLRRTLSPPLTSRTARHHSPPRSHATQAELEWNKELVLHQAMAQAVQDAHRGGGGGAAMQLMAFSPPRAPRNTHAQSAPTLHRGSATTRLPKKQPRRPAFAPPLHATANAEGLKLGVVAFGV